MTQSTTLLLLGFDTETHLIAQENLFPCIVCLSWHVVPAQTDGSATTELYGNADWNQLRAACKILMRDVTSIKVGQNLGYDLGVIATNFPESLGPILDALEDGQFSDTMIREKLLQLTETGDLEYVTGPGGAKVKLSFSMEALVLKYLGIDLSGVKNDSDSYRLNYKELDGIPVDQWPVKARDYATDDAKYAVAIWKAQEDRRQGLITTRGIDPFLTEAFRVKVDFCLKLMAAWGAKTDPAEIGKVEAMLAEELKPEKLALLISSGILRPAEPPRPHKKAKPEPCPNPKCVRGQEPIGDGLGVCSKCGGTGTTTKMTAGVEESIDTKALKDHVLGYVVIHNPDIKLVYTDPSKTFPNGQLSINSDWLAEYASRDPVLSQYKHRQNLQKIVTTEIPRMKLNGVIANVVHPQYDCLKETGRTSSYSSKSKEYASFNCQNVDPRVKNCYVARPGYVLFSCDYSQMELGTLAQTCYRLFSYSVLRDKINAGVDVHAYTGAQLMMAMSGKVVFEDCRGQAITDKDAIFDNFMVFKTGTEAQQSLYKHWRKFAKPVNLGYPGGLGPATFVTYAASEQYGVTVTKEEAHQLRDLWKATYPEMIDYFKYINRNCLDPHNKGFDSKTNTEYDLYAYDTPYGMHRAGCDYCACANGLGLQSPSAEGALTALINLIPACYDTRKCDILSPDNLGPTVRPWGFVHDEFVGEIREDSLAHERVAEIQRIMIEGMRIVTPDVVAKANACLMRKWDKRAEPVFDENGRLTIWSPK